MVKNFVQKFSKSFSEVSLKTKSVLFFLIWILPIFITLGMITNLIPDQYNLRKLFLDKENATLILSLVGLWGGIGLIYGTYKGYLRPFCGNCGD